MKVIKKDGRLQPFDLEKIKMSIQRASDDIGEPLNKSDVDEISRSIESKVFHNFDDKVNYFEITKLVIETLVEYGFSKTAKAYDAAGKS